MNSKKKLVHTSKPLLVATAHTRRGLSAAARLRPGVFDLVEVRLDCLATNKRLLAGVVSRARVPLLLTARHPAEGGGGGLTVADRRALLEEFMPFASAIDVELRSANLMRPLLCSAAEMGVARVISFHDFRGTPSLQSLRGIVSAARKVGADIVKIATLLRGPSDLAVLLQLQAMKSSCNLATMGMGGLGRVSRLVLAAAGSRLNYGFLDIPQVPGQWPALQLRERIHELLP